MIVVIRKKNVLVVALLLIFSITVFGIGFASDYSKPVAGVSEQEPINQQAVQKTVILDAGHGGEDPGAVSDYSGLKEKDVNLNIVMQIKGLLEKDNYKVILTRDSDQLVYGTETKNILQKRREDLTRRKQIMDESGADIVVSVHLNKFAQTKYHGAQAFFPPNSPDSQKLANEIQNSIRLNVDNANDRVALVKKDQIMILKNLKTTTVVVECGFLSNSDEEKNLASEDYQTKLAKAIKGGIDNYFKGDSTKKDDATKKDDGTKKDSATMKEDDSKKDDATDKQGATKKDSATMKEEDAKKDDDTKKDSATMKEDDGKKDDDAKKDSATMKEDSTNKDDSTNNEDNAKPAE